MSEPEISRRCRKCGASIRRSGAFCSQCGEKYVRTGGTGKVRNSNGATKNATLSGETKKLAEAQKKQKVTEQSEPIAPDSVKTEFIAPQQATPSPTPHPIIATPPSAIVPPPVQPLPQEVHDVPVMAPPAERPAKARARTYVDAAPADPTLRLLIVTGIFVALFLVLLFTSHILR